MGIEARQSWNTTFAITTIACTGVGWQGLSIAANEGVTPVISHLNHSACRGQWHRCLLLSFAGGQHSLFEINLPIYQAKGGQVDCRTSTL